MHIDSMDGEIVVSVIVIDSFIGVATGRVDRDFIFVFSEITASSLLFDRA